MPRRTEPWEGCRWTRIDPPVNVVPSEPTVHQLLFILTSSVIDKKLEIDKKTSKLNSKLTKISKINSKFIAILNSKINSKFSSFSSMVDELNIALKPLIWSNPVKIHSFYYHLPNWSGFIIIFKNSLCSWEGTLSFTLNPDPLITPTPLCFRPLPFTYSYLIEPHI